MTSTNSGNLGGAVYARAGMTIQNCTFSGCSSLVLEEAAFTATSAAL